MRRSAAITGMMNISSRHVQDGRRQIHTTTMMQQKATINGRAKLLTGHPRRLNQKAGSNVTATPVAGARKRALSGCISRSAAVINDQPRLVQSTSKAKVRANGSSDMPCIYDTHKELSTRPKPRSLKLAARKNAGISRQRFNGLHAARASVAKKPMSLVTGAF